MCCEHFLGVLQEIFSPTMQFTTSVLKLSWHCQSLNEISSNCHLVKERQAFDTCIRTSGAVKALHNSLSDIVLYFYLFANWFVSLKFSYSSEGVSLYDSFLGAFARLQKATIRFFMSVHLSDHMEQLGSH